MGEPNISKLNHIYTVFIPHLPVGKYMCLSSTDLDMAHDIKALHEIRCMAAAFVLWEQKVSKC